MKTLFSALCTLLLLAACSSAPEGTEGQVAPSGESASEAPLGGSNAPADSDWPVPAPGDVRTLDGLMTAYYEVVSGPAGETRDWRRDKSLHVPGAQVVITSEDEDGSVRINDMTISDYHARSPGPATQPFYEYELQREVRQHGTTVHIWSTYEWSTEPDGPAGGRGVNSVEAVWDGTRYWLTSWTYDGRGSAPPVPSEFLPEGS